MSRITIRSASRADTNSSTKDCDNRVLNKLSSKISDTRGQNSKNLHHHLLAGTALALAFGFAVPAFAAPTGGSIANGAASITLTGESGRQNTTIRQTSSRAVINWGGFDLAKGDSVNFLVPDQNSATLNRISGARSIIEGSIQSNGSLYFVNQNGFVFGADSHVTAQNLIVTTQAIDAAQFMQPNSPTSSGNYQNFTGTSLAAASIELNGTVTVADRGVVGFFAPQVTASKSSVIAANLGSVTLAGSENVTFVDFKGDGLINFQLGDSANEILEKHEGVIRANGGQVILTAHGAKNLLNAVLEENGTVDASSVDGKGGNVTLVAANGTVTIGKNAVIDTSSAKDPAGVISVSDSFNSAYIGPITFSYWALVQQQKENQAVQDLKASQTITIESGAVLKANGHAARNIGVTNNSTAANEGSIFVRASNKLNNSGSLTSHSGLIALTAVGDVHNEGALTVNNAVGKAGDILVNGASINLSDGSVFDTSSASGSAGNIKLSTQTGELWIAKGAKILAKSVNGYGIVTVQSKSNLQFDGTIEAPAAVVNVDVAKDFVVNGVLDLSSSTSKGGDFHANAANILVTQQGVINASSKVSEAGSIILGHASTTANVTIDLGGKLFANSLAGLKGGTIKLNANQTVQNNGTIQAQAGTISLLAQGPDNVLSAALINNGVIDASAVIGDGGEVTLSTTSGIVTLGSQSVIDVSSQNGKSGGKVSISDDYTGSLEYVPESATDIAYKKAKANLDQKTNDYINTTHERENARNALETARKDYSAAVSTLTNAKLELENIQKGQFPSDDAVKNATQKVTDATQTLASATVTLRDANVKFESFTAKIDAAKLEVSVASGEYIVAEYKLAHDPISNLAVTARVNGQTVTFAEGSQIKANGGSGGSIRVRAFKNLLNNGTIQSSGGDINLTAAQNLVNNGIIDGTILSGQGGVVTLNSVHGTLTLGDNSVIDVSSKNGDGGQISVLTHNETQTLVVQSGSVIKANSDKAGHAGNITLAARGDLDIDGKIEALVGDQSGNGGNICLITAHELHTHKLSIDSSAGTGLFGILQISAPDIVVQGEPEGAEIILVKPLANNTISASDLDGWLQHNNVTLNSTAPKPEGLAQAAIGGKVVLHSNNDLTLHAGVGGLSVSGSVENMGFGKLTLKVNGDHGDKNFAANNKLDATKFGNLSIDGAINVHNLTASVTNSGGRILLSKNGVLTVTNKASFSTDAGDIVFNAPVTVHEVSLTTQGGAIALNDDVTLAGNGSLDAKIEGAGDITFAKDKTVLGGRSVKLSTKTGTVTLGKDLIVSDDLQLAVKDILANGVNESNLQQLTGADSSLKIELGLITRIAENNGAHQSEAIEFLAKIQPELAARLKLYALAAGSGTAEQKANAVMVLGVFDPSFASEYAAAQTIETQRIRDAQSDLVIHHALQRYVVQAKNERYLAAIERDKALTPATRASVNLAFGVESTGILLSSDANFRTKFSAIYGQDAKNPDDVNFGKSDLVSYDTKTQEAAFKRLADLDEVLANNLKTAIRNAQALPTGTDALNAAQQQAYKRAIDAYLKASADKAQENLLAQAKMDVLKSSRSELLFNAKKIITGSDNTAPGQSQHDGANGQLTTRDVPSNYVYFDLDAGGGSFTYNQTGNDGTALTINHKYAATTDPSVVKAKLSDAQVITINNNGPLILVGVDTLIGTLKASTASDLTVNSTITANGTVELSAGGNLTVTGAIKAQGSITLASLHELQVNSALEAGGNVTLSSTHMNFGNKPGNVGSLKAGKSGTISLTQTDKDTDFNFDSAFIALLNYQSDNSLIVDTGRNISVSSALAGSNATNISLKAGGNLTINRPITTGGLVLDAKNVIVSTYITVGAGGLTVTANNDERTLINTGILFYTVSLEQYGLYSVKATDGGAITLNANNHSQILFQSDVIASNLTIKSANGDIRFNKPVLIDSYKGEGGAVTINVNGPDGVIFHDIVTANSILINSKSDSPLSFDKTVTLNNFIPKGGTKPTSGGTISITTENGNISFAKYAPIVSNDPSGLPYKIILTSKRGIILDTDVGVRAGGMLSLEAWRINYTKLKADDASIVFKQNGYMSRYWAKKLVKVAAYNVTLNDKISVNNAKLIYIQTLGTITVNKSISASTVALIGNQVVYGEGAKVSTTPGGTLALVQFSAFIVDKELLSKFTGYENSNFKLISGGKLSVVDDIKMNDGRDLSLSGFDIDIAGNISLRKATLSLNYINPDTKVTANFTKSSAEHIFLGKACNFEVTGASNLVINGSVVNQYISSYKLSEGKITDGKLTGVSNGVLTINANVTAIQGLTFAAKNGSIIFNNVVGITSPYGEPVIVTTQDNAKYVTYGPLGKILPLPASE